MKVVARFVFSRTFVRSLRLLTLSNGMQSAVLFFFLRLVWLTIRSRFLSIITKSWKDYSHAGFFSHTGGQLMAIQKTRNGGVSPTLCNTTAIWRGGGGRWLTDRSNISCVRNKGERWMWIRLASGKSEGGTFGATSSYWKLFFWMAPPAARTNIQAWGGGGGRGMADGAGARNGTSQSWSGASKRNKLKRLLFLLLSRIPELRLFFLKSRILGTGIKLSYQCACINIKKKSWPGNESLAELSFLSCFSVS